MNDGNIGCESRKGHGGHLTPSLRDKTRRPEGPTGLVRGRGDVSCHGVSAPRVGRGEESGACHPRRAHHQAEMAPGTALSACRRALWREVCVRCREAGHVGVCSVSGGRGAGFRGQGGRSVRGLVTTDQTCSLAGSWVASEHGAGTHGIPGAAVGGRTEAEPSEPVTGCAAQGGGRRALRLQGSVPCLSGKSSRWGGLPGRQGTGAMVAAQLSCRQEGEHLGKETALGRLSPRLSSSFLPHKAARSVLTPVP